MDPKKSNDILFPVFVFALGCDIFLLESWNSLKDLERIDVEQGEYYKTYDSKGQALDISIDPEGNIILTILDDKPILENLIRSIRNEYIDTKPISKTFIYTGPPDDPVGLFKQFEAHRFEHSIVGRIIKLYKKLFKKSAEGK